MQDLNDVRALAAQQFGVVSRRQLLAAGLSRSSVDSWIRRYALRPLLPATYLVDPEIYPERWPLLPFETRFRAARLYAGPEAVTVLGTAAQLLGIEGLAADNGTIHLARKPGEERPQIAGLALHTWKLRTDEVQRDSSGQPITSVVRTLSDLLLRTGRLAATSAVDSALNKGLVETADLAEVTAAMAGRRNAVSGRAWLAKTDGRAQSPLETRIRLIASDAGFPPDVLQLPVVNRQGQLLGYGDLAWFRPGRRTLIGECDGTSVHATPVAVFRDRYRANDFITLGEVDIVRFTWRDAEQPAYVRSVLRSALLEAA